MNDLEFLNPLTSMKDFQFNKEISKKIKNKKIQTPEWTIISLGSVIENGNIVLEDEKLHTAKDLDNLCADQVKRTRVLESRSQLIQNALISNFSRTISEGTVTAEATIMLLENKNMDLMEKRGLTERLKNSLNPEHEKLLTKKYERTVARTLNNSPKPAIK